MKWWQLRLLCVSVAAVLAGAAIATNAHCDITAIGTNDTICVFHVYKR
jgi:hypothetical protein